MFLLPSFISPSSRVPACGINMAGATLDLQQKHFEGLKHFRVMPLGSASILKISVNVLQSLHKNWHFPFRTSLLNVNISAVFSRFVHSSYLPKKSLIVNFIFAVQFQIIFFTQTIPRVIMLSWGKLCSSV